MRQLAALALLAAFGLASPALARDDLRYSGKLLLTGGVSNIEGAGGGGLASWATTTSYASHDGIGADLHGTLVNLADYQLRSWGAAVSLFDRVELSYASQDFDTGKTGAKLGLGKGFTFNQQIYGAKAVVYGDSVYDQDRLWPQIAVGAQYKVNDQGAIIRALGGQSDKGTDYYVAATKLLLDKSLLVNATARWTEANQTGLLGFGGPNGRSPSLQFEGSAAYLVNKRLAVGAEYRTKPDNLGLKEDDAFDAFAAYALNKNLSLTAAYVDLGEIATFKGQHGLYLSLQTGF
ncbi:MAG: hypothetical protein JWM33_1414 [Caulobacteraceae bacterium]|nr:hypothetical protein [Caulobacteraceae bacterium]